MTTLKKVLKLRTVISASAGMALATSCYLAGFQVATIVVGELAWISILIAGLLCLLSAMCFSELTSQYPTAAGIKLFIQKAFNEKAAIIIGSFYVLLGISMVGAESYLLASVLVHAFDIVSPTFDRAFWLVFFILAVAAINYRGIRLTGFVQDILTYTMIGFLIFVSLYAIFKIDLSIIPALTNPQFTLSNVITAAAVGVFLYVGFRVGDAAGRGNNRLQAYRQGNDDCHRPAFRDIRAFYRRHVDRPDARTEAFGYEHPAYPFRPEPVRENRACRFYSHEHTCVGHVF